MDDLDPEIKEGELEEDGLDSDIDDGIILGKKKPKDSKDDDSLSLDDLALEEEGGVLPEEDSFDDVDLW